MKVDQNISTDDYLAKLFLKDNGLNYVYKDDILYTYHKKYGLLINIIIN